VRKVVKKKLLKIAGVILSFCLVFGITFTLNTMYIKKNTQLVVVAVASKKIPAFSLLEGSSITLAKRPLAVVPQEAVFNPEEFLEGKKLYAGDLGFGEGDMIRTDRLVEEKDSALLYLAGLAVENSMLVAVNTNLVRSCANMVVPGTMVNAVVVIKGQLINEPDRVIGPDDDSRLGNLLVVDKKNAEGAKPAASGRDAIPAVITLLLDGNNLEVAKALVHYNEKGSIYLLPVGFQGDVYLASASSLLMKEKEKDW
jgi:hypothetical protein